ncbi:protein transport protein SEC16B homolog isoform X1 [Syzygium oleosum]|uniref:protein transport protein SEC16B homolog isoform X1 n=1 Tax=Syzygium oleosum TaxID=219896 RepID=UPI0011D23E1D|nr:protein transport protein SEC16B homolog isoform X1 [Syzygium oleosum]
MASNPPFEMEDQTDEDFFEKLVDDDDDFAPPGSASASGSDAARKFSNLSIVDSGEGADPKLNREDSADFGVADQVAPPAGEKKALLPPNSFDLSSAVGAEPIKGAAVESLNDGSGHDAMGSRYHLDAASGSLSVAAGESSALASANSFEFDSLIESNDNGTGSQDLVDPVKEKDGGSGKGIKEVGWSSFHAEAVEHTQGHGFGSYSDFFTSLDNSGGEFSGNFPEDSNHESVIAAGSAENQADGLENSAHYAQYQQDQGYGAGDDQTANVHDLSGSQYWENLYPGWKYDSNTGQWYQVDGYNPNMNLQGNSGNTAVQEWPASSDGTSEVSYLQQTAQSIVGTAAEAGTTESVYSMNQVSEGNNGYPDHMVFDPQYPGWYYDMIAQEWRTLESYTSSLQSSGQGHGYQNQDGSIATDVTSQAHNSVHGDYGQANNYGSQINVGQSQDGHWDGSYSEYSQPSRNDTRQLGTVAKSDAISNFGGQQQFDTLYGSEVAANNHINPQNSFNSFGAVESHGKSGWNKSEVQGAFGSQSFIPSQPFNQAMVEQHDQLHFSNDLYANQKPVNFYQQSFQGTHQFTPASNVGLSSAGRPAHALVTFGFGGKLIVMKDATFASNPSYGGQDSSGSSIAVLNIIEVFQKKNDASGNGFGACNYLHALCQQSFPGPLVGGSVGSKELNKWMDERIANCESPDMDYKKAEALKLLLSLLKIACQHYGKLRSPFGTETAFKEGDSPETAVAKLFASSKKTNGPFGGYNSENRCLQFLPSPEQIQATASEVQNLLVSGRKKEALQCAQEGQLWGPALILASQLGDQFYVDTVKQMALVQMVPGSPLRTLCLLIAGQPAEVFSADTTPASAPVTTIMSQRPAQPRPNGMLEDWEENLAVIAANRTKDDELVIIHLGDSLWKEKSEIIAAHICYLVAEANFESYSDTARLCLVGADHWKCPRTYASPGSIQRTELYEYSKVLGNSQFILLPFQPYKLIYAYMLAEVGKVSDSLKYCQALSKSLKTGRAPEVDMWKQAVLSLEERIRAHQQGGYSANMAPAKLVGKLLNFFDNTAHRVVGGLPPPAPSTSQASIQGIEQFQQPVATKVLSSQSTMTMSSLIPSASMEWPADSSKMTMQNRSVSEPDFGRTPRQVDSSNEITSANAQGKASASERTSRFGRFGFGSQLLQKTVGLVLRPRSDRQAKLGETNKFYYDEKLKRWVEEGADPPAEEPALAPPPTTAAFQNGMPDYNLKSALKSEGLVPNGSPDFTSPTPSDHTSGIPPIPPSSNQFSARGRMGVRSRYVDTFNQGGGSPANLFKSPSVPAVKPAVAANAKFFIPTQVVSSGDHTMEAIAESAQEETSTTEEPSTSSAYDLFKTSVPPSTAMQRFPSMGNIPSKVTTSNENGSFESHSRRTASWSGSFNDALHPPKNVGVKPLGEALGMPPSAYVPSNPTSMPMPMNGGGFADDLHEVEL